MSKSKLTDNLSNNSSILSNSLSDSEIVKALDSYKKDIGCAKCGFKDKYLFTVIENALFSNTRLQAENKRLSTLAELGNKRANDYRVMRDRALKAEAENERLENAFENSQKTSKYWKSKCEELVEELETAKAEIEGLEEEKIKARRKALLEAMSKFAGHSDYHGDTILCKLICMAEGKEVGIAKPLDVSEIKAEAYKEFADKVSDIAVQYYPQIQNLLKELEGEDDGKEEK